MSDRILVAGVGNIFLGDDAFGVEVVQRLAQRRLPEHAHVRDFGIRSYDLAYALMEPWSLTILVDAVARGGAPGTLYTIEPEMPVDGGSIDIDAHSMNPVSVLQLVTALGGKAGRMLVIGCEPQTIDPDESGAMGLSDPVQAAVDEAVGMIEELIAANANATAARRKGRRSMSAGKIIKWGALGAGVYMLVYFRGDIQRYVKMKRM